MPRIKKANPMLNPNNPDYINYLYGISKEKAQQKKLNISTKNTPVNMHFVHINGGVFYYSCPKI